VAEVGLFCGLVTDLIIATPDGVEHLEKPRPGGTGAASRERN
jgi:hypothetical protein